MDKLTEIIAHKQLEAAGFNKKSFKHALKQQHLSVIAEVKRKSPSAGNLAPIANPISLALQYQQGGAAALSVLTDAKYFGGSLEDLKQVASGVSLPLLRKDFIIHPMQIAEAALAGASAVLLIAAVLGNALPRMVRITEEMGLDALVEVHSQDEVLLAVDAGASLLGVNSRNLRTFEVDTGIFEKLLPLIPHEIVKVAESGIKSVKDARSLRSMGYDAVLVGEALVCSRTPAKLIDAMRCL
mgnify:CR=1 FL=1